MRTGFIAVWVDHQFIDQLRLDQHITAAAAFVDNETNGLMHLVDGAFVVKALDHLGKTVNQIGMIRADLNNFGLVFFFVLDQGVCHFVVTAFEILDHGF